MNRGKEIVFPYTRVPPNKYRRNMKLRKSLFDRHNSDYYFKQKSSVDA